MLHLFGAIWALLLGVFMLMIGNGIQGTLLGLRGGIENFSTTQMSYIMAAYFLGFLGGSRMSPYMIRRVGHVRVFAALGSMISAVMILYPVLPDPLAWGLGRVVIGFCFAGVYVTAESWLNKAVSNENRGAALSLYVVVQMAGIVLAQGLLTQADPGGFVLFIVPSVLVSLAFAPILLSVQPAPAFATSKPLALRALFNISPLTSVGMLLLGGVYSAQFTMVAVYGGQIGLSVAQISSLVSIIYGAALLAQFPLGLLSDRMDRRVMILVCAALGGLGAVIAALSGGDFLALALGAGMMGAMANPLYALLLAHANDYIAHEQMSAASSGYLFIHGAGSILGPITSGALMSLIGAVGFWLQFAALLLGVAGYAAYRMTQRGSFDGESVAIVPVTAEATPVAVGLVQEEYIAREIEAEIEAEDVEKDEVTQ